MRLRLPPTTTIPITPAPHSVAHNGNCELLRDGIRAADVLEAVV